MILLRATDFFSRLAIFDFINSRNTRLSFLLQWARFSMIAESDLIYNLKSFILVPSVNVVCIQSCEKISPRIADQFPEAAFFCMDVSGACSATSDHTVPWVTVQRTNSQDVHRSRRKAIA